MIITYDILGGHLKMGLIWFARGWSLIYWLFALGVGVHPGQESICTIGDKGRGF
jgi:hypothetical protein